MTPMDRTATARAENAPAGDAAELGDDARAERIEPRPAERPTGPSAASRWSSVEPAASGTPPRSSWPVLPIAGPGAAATTGACARLRSSGLEPARGLRALPDPPDAS